MRQADLPEALRSLSPNGGVVHATAVARGGRALLFVGPSGSGKSALALALIAQGARLVSDDRTRLTPGAEDGPILAAAPGNLSGVIEARGLGLLRTEPARPTPVAAVVDLGTETRDRLPPMQEVRLLGRSLPLLHKVESAHFAAALAVYLDGGMCDA